jgi:hypothetical protein
VGAGWYAAGGVGGYESGAYAVEVVERVGEVGAAVELEFAERAGG